MSVRCQLSLQPEAFPWNAFKLMSQPPTGFMRPPQLIRQRNRLLEKLPAPLGFSLFFDWFLQQVSSSEVLPIVHTDIHPGNTQPATTPGDALYCDALACGETTRYSKQQHLTLRSSTEIRDHSDGTWSVGVTCIGCRPSSKCHKDKTPTGPGGGILCHDVFMTEIDRGSELR